MTSNAAVDVDQLAGESACTLDAVLPVQLESGRADASLVPEKRLMLAVLEEAVFTFQRDALGGGGAELAEVEHWFADDDREWPFSFENICSALELEPSFVRHGLAEWVRRRALLPNVERRRLRNPFRRMNGSRHRPSGRPKKPVAKTALEVVR